MSGEADARTATSGGPEAPGGGPTPTLLDTSRESGDPGGGGPAAAVDAGSRTDTWSANEQARAKERAASGDLPAPPGFTVTGELGRGGMGVVYRARQEGLDREVAVKAVLPGRGGKALEGFVEEALLTGGLDHPNIPPVHVFERGRDGQAYLAMKLVRGLPWSSLLHPATEAQRARAAAMDLRAHLEVLKRTADAIAYANDRGIVHRDLKPANIMVGAFGEVLVMDWGIALDTRRRERAPAHDPVGTPVYMAPEMAAGDPSAIGPWTDVYQLGGLLYEVLTGAPPHEGPNAFAVIHAAKEGRVRPAAERAKGRAVEEGLAAIAGRALEKDPARRYPSALAFAQAIEEHERCRAARALADAGDLEVDAARRAAQAKAPAAQVYGHFGAAVAALAQALAQARGALVPGGTSAGATGDAVEARLSAARVAFARYAARAGDLALAESELSRASADAPDLPAARAEVKAVRADRDRRTRRRTTLLVTLALLLSLAAVVAAREWRLAAALEEAQARRARAQAEIAGSVFSTDQVKVAAARRATEIDPGWAGAHCQLGMALYAGIDDPRYAQATDPAPVVARFRASVDAFGQALALEPDHAPSLNDQAYCLAVLGEGPRSLALFARCAALGDDAVESVEAGATLALGEGRFAESRDGFARCIARKPQPWSFFGRAAARAGLGDLDGALEDAAIARRVKPEDEWIAALVALILLARDDLRAAGTLFAQELVKHEEGPRLLPLYAVYAARLGDRPRARAALARGRLAREKYRALLAEDPWTRTLAREGLPTAMLARAVLLEVDLDRDGLLAPGPARSVELVAEGEEALGWDQPAVALARADQALALDPASGAARIVRVGAMHKLGTPARALRDELLEAAALAPDRAGAIEALLDKIAR